MMHLGVFLGADFRDYPEGEGEGVARAAAGDDTPACYGGTRLEPEAGRLQLLLETVEAGDGASLYAFQLREHQAGRRADAGYGATGVVMLLHEFHEGLAGCQIAGAGHASGENENVFFSGAFMADVHELEAAVRADGDTMRGTHERFFADCDEFAPETRPAQDVVGAEGLYVLEAVRKKNVDSFHTEKISIFAFVNIGKIMEEEKKLYPFRLCPVEDVFAWGKEEWMLADLGWRDTAVRDGWLAGNALGEIMETYLDRVVGDEVFDWYGLQFPFSVKTLKFDGRMPLTASPEDLTALERYDSLGKEKFWYVLEATPETKIFLGLRKDMDAAAFMAACEDGSVESLLNKAPVKAGSYYHIPPGVPHCLAGKATVLEISQSSALDFRLCDWGLNTGEGSDYGLGLVEALDFLNLSKSVQSLCIFYFYFLQGTMYCLVTRIKRYPDEFIDFKQKCSFVLGYY